MKPKRVFFSLISFYDMLFIIVLILFMFFALTLMQVRPDSKKADIETKAEYVITVTWPKDCQDDVDTWLKDPLDNIMFYKHKEIPMAHLDRDDRGYTTDWVKLADGKMVIYPYNQEITTIRGFIAGEWVLNVHMYDKWDIGTIKVQIKIEKLNPVTKLVFTKTVSLTLNGEEKTVVRFEMTAGGQIISLNYLPMILTDKMSSEEP